MLLRGFAQEEWLDPAWQAEQAPVEAPSWVKEWVGEYQPAKEGYQLVQTAPYEPGGSLHRGPDAMISESTSRSSGLLPVLNNIIASVGTVLGKYMEVEGAKSRAGAAVPYTGAYAKPSGLSALTAGMSGTTMLLIAGAAVGLIVMSRKKKKATA